MIRASAAWLAVSLLATGAMAQQKKRVAVLDFEYATVQSSVQAIFGGNRDVGKGIADVLIDKLVAGGAYSVIERKAIDKIMAEQNFSNSDRADANTAAKLGRILGVDAIILGSITQFGRDDKKTNVGGKGVGRLTGSFGIGGVQRTSSKAVVAVTARMVNTTTAEILASATAHGESTRSGTGLLGAGGSSSAAGGGVLDMNSSNFANTILCEAVHSAVSDLARQLGSKAGSLPTAVRSIEGLVADAAADGTVILNVGSRAGVKVGDQLQVKRKVREVRDPSTGRVLRSVEDKLGTVTITEVDEQSSVGKYSGSQPAKVGDVVSNR